MLDLEMLFVIIRFEKKHFVNFEFKLWFNGLQS